MKELIEQLLHEKPFRTICVIMRSGERFEIADRTRVALGWKRMTVFLRTKVVQVGFDEVELAFQPRITKTRPRSAGVLSVPFG